MTYGKVKRNAQGLSRFSRSDLKDYYYIIRGKGGTITYIINYIFLATIIIIGKKLSSRVKS